MEIASLVALLGFIAASILAATTGAVFRPGQWYEQLSKPFWRPPNGLFPPTWAVLYLTIAVSGWLVWRVASLSSAVLPLTIYFLQLGLNAAWSPIFFGMRRPDLAFLEILALWAAIVATVIAFYPIHAVAAWLLLPYLAWVTFAAALNFSVWRLNLGQTPTR
jgi:benzodiazapine receptor